MPGSGEPDFDDPFEKQESQEREGLLDKVSKGPFAIRLSCVDTFLAVHMYLQPDMIPSDPGFVASRTAFNANDHYYLPLMGSPLGTSLLRGCRIWNDCGYEVELTRKRLVAVTSVVGMTQDPNRKKQAREDREKGKLKGEAEDEG